MDKEAEIQEKALLSSFALFPLHPAGNRLKLAETLINKGFFDLYR